MMMPAHFNAGIRTNPLRTVMRLASAVIGPDLRGAGADAPPQPANCGWIAAVSLIVAMALFLIVAGHAAGRRGDEAAPLFFWSGVILLVLPTSFRIASPLVARGERLFLLFLLVEALFYYKVVYSPTSFIHHDEFLHWVAVDDLMTVRRLFVSNPLLPVGPAYPALEILTIAIVDLTGLPLFAAATLLLAVLKGTFITALFLFYERIAGSVRLAAIACLVYMGCSTFVLFDAMFSYESLGVVLCVLIFAIEAASKDLVVRARLKAIGLMALLLASLAVTHHLSAAFAAIYLGALAAFEVVRRSGRAWTETGLVVGLTAILAVALPLLWLQAQGNPLTSYLGPVVETGVKTLLGKFQGMPAADRSVAVAAPAQPLGMRLTTLLGVLLLALGLATGFFRSLAVAAPNGVRAGWPAVQAILERRWRDSRMVILTLLAFGFPISVAFRLTIGGWEIGNRMGTFVFMGVGLVVAVSIVRFWQGPTPVGWRLIGPAVSLAVIVMGGVTAASLDPIRGPYRPAADPQSVEPLGIETALWTKQWLEAGNRFTADRVNRLLLASYGRQDVKIKIIEGVDVSRIFKTEELSAEALHILAKSDIDFLLVDRRLSMSPPVLGFYFEPWEAGKGAVISTAALLKFNDVQGITRIYDNGWIVIYDLRGLHGLF
jgi:hypothetical protein